VQLLKQQGENCALVISTSLVLSNKSAISYAVRSILIAYKNKSALQKQRHAAAVAAASSPQLLFLVS